MDNGQAELKQEINTIQGQGGERFIWETGIRRGKDTHKEEGLGRGEGLGWGGGWGAHGPLLFKQTSKKYINTRKVF